MKGNKLKIMLHLAFWAVVIILPWFMISGNLEQPGFFEGRYYLRLLNGGLLFYLTYFFLVPRLFLNNRKQYFYISVLLAIGILFGATELMSNWLFPDDLLIQRMDLIREKIAAEGFKFNGPSPSMRYVNSIFASILVAALAMGLRVTEAYSEKEKQNRELEKEKLTADLGLLKNQVSPHFFFNTLNNIYALIESGSADAGTAVLKLSKMMRYVLHDSEQNKVSLDQEMAFMNHYIDLMRLRLSEKVKISVDFRPHSGEIGIPSMIFISFIENAFKHGVSYREPSFIEISLKTSATELIFSCINSRFTEQDHNAAESSGIGLENVKKRLDLIFPGKHKLDISETPATFSVLLTINLNQ
jgi:two-component system, LytTR family, sensor kinase